jgi:hypothetical protein
VLTTSRNLINAAALAGVELAESAGAPLASEAPISN